jgi:hypothetical protein
LDALPKPQLHGREIAMLAQTMGPAAIAKHLGIAHISVYRLLYGGMMGDLYDADILEWSEHQARLLRQHAVGKAGNEAPDWANIIEEVESVGRDQLHAVESLLAQALAHMLKAEAWPLSREVPGWQAEARRFRDDAAARFSPSMRQRIDVAKLYRRALRILPDTIDGLQPLPVPEVCPVTLDELLSDEG